MIFQKGLSSEIEWHVFMQNPGRISALIAFLGLAEHEGIGWQP